MDIKKYTRATIEGWNEAAPIHARHNMARYLEEFSQPGFIVFDELEANDWQELGVEGKDIAQLGCNNGRELISIKNMGTNRCVGFDGSVQFIRQAEQLNQAAMTDCEFVCTDIYDFDGAYDLIYISIGVLSWMPDIEQFFSILVRLLKSQGLVYIHEQHPILDMIEPGDADSPVIWDYSYFKTDPFIDTDGLDYYGNQRYDAKPVYSFHHKLSDIFTAAIGNNLYIDAFEELPEHIANCWYNVDKQGPELPMSYVLILLKE